VDTQPNMIITLLLADRLTQHTHAQDGSATLGGTDNILELLLLFSAFGSGTGTGTGGGDMNPLLLILLLDALKGGKGIGL